MQTPYPPLEPYRTHSLHRGPHTLHVEECGNPEGLPVIVLHGGPGSGCRSYLRSFFNPELYRIILHDQRGAGKSSPHGELSNNTTKHLLDDIDDLIQHLNIGQRLLFGGSWGATLALLHAERHPKDTAALILRGVFLARQEDLDWFIGPKGARCIYPDTWKQCTRDFNTEEQQNPIKAFHERLNSNDELAQRRAVQSWQTWSAQLLFGDSFNAAKPPETISREQLNECRIELHYAMNNYFIPENAILNHAEKLQHLPITILQGRRDLVCPTVAAHSLKTRLPKAQLHILKETGHLATEPAMTDALITATNAMAEQLKIRQNQG